ncbi:TetR/AcrR family transcriptional regulator [Mycobacterium sp. PS03-16]|uniref:TetR/AcrR family transcriptional regulator n=1 Tax=Mycobacterium sp. PS03-16 TaxID=2559611 RepID=UPI00107408D2|nr:TetR/AcrR family transcriptional regulator [Mycobacterium sp. PS03-16]TFV58397.1 TetR/AcrR family transcriptional regulator [Mycobacterium sp. PS03-16]
MTDPDTQGRRNQRTRTRKDLLHAAARLMKQGRRPSLEDVAEEALVSRATAYRYFPSVDALLREAAIDVAMPGPEEVLAADDEVDPVARLQRVGDAMHSFILANETAVRMMVAYAIENHGRQDGDGDPPRRQNRRLPMIEAALEPAHREFRPTTLSTLVHALALVIGPEAMIVCKDVLQLDDAETQVIQHFAIRALVEAARKEP